MFGVAPAGRYGLVTVTRSKDPTCSNIASIAARTSGSVDAGFGPEDDGAADARRRAPRSAPRAPRSRGCCRIPAPRTPRRTKGRWRRLPRAPRPQPPPTRRRSCAGGGSTTRRLEGASWPLALAGAAWPADRWLSWCREVGGAPLEPNSGTRKGQRTTRMRTRYPSPTLTRRPPLATKNARSLELHERMQRWRTTGREHGKGTVDAVGGDFSGGVQSTAVDQIELGAVRKFLEPLELDCPLHYDTDAAKQQGYRGVLAPVSGVSSTWLDGRAVAARHGQPLPAGSPARRHSARTRRRDARPADARHHGGLCHRRRDRVLRTGGRR